MRTAILYVVEPIPEQRGAGRVILLNGASSSGKSTLAKALQAALPQPFLHVSSDQLVQAGMLPHRSSDGGAFDWWHQIRPRFFAGQLALLRAGKRPPGAQEAPPPRTLRVAPLTAHWIQRLW